MMRKIWIFSFIALVFSLFLVFSSLSMDSSLGRVDTSFILSSGQEVLDPAFPFSKAGTIKNRTEWSLATSLPETQGESLSFVSIGSRVSVFVDQVPVYRFGSDLNGKDIWGVKTHLIPLPDGPDGRKVSLFFETNEPFNIGVSSFLYLDPGVSILEGLFKENLILLFFPLLYISIGLFLLILAFQSGAFHQWNVTLFILALLSFSIGIRILLNISIVAYYAGPRMVFWCIQISNFVIPLLVLLMLSFEKNLVGKRILWILAGFHGLILTLWIVGNLQIATTDFRLIYWNNYLFVLTSFFIVAILGREFLQGRKHWEISVSLAFISIAVFYNAYMYYQFGVQDTMDYSLTILTFPILVLTSGRTLYERTLSNQQILMENAALKTHGDLLVQNYHRIEHYIEETKKIWHDIDKHTSVVYALAEDESYEELKKYLKGIGYSTRRAKDSYLTDNKLINAIFTDKREVASSCGIQWAASLEITEEIKIDANDLCSLLINLLDNALEACCLVPAGLPRYIQIKLHMQNNFLYIRMDNSHSQNPIKGNSRKSLHLFGKGKVHHGYGLKIIESITDRYDGLYETSQTEQVYSAQVALKNRPYELI